MGKKKVLKKYIYRTELKRVVDGDTVIGMIDVGFGIHKLTSIRLEGIDCPETRTRNLQEKEHGKKSKAFLKSILPKKFKITSHKIDLYGRCLATLWMLDEAGNTININREMVVEGMAIRYDGKAKKEYDAANYTKHSI